MFRFFIQRLFFFSVLVAAAIAFFGVFYYAVMTEEESKRPEHYVSPFGEGSRKPILEGIEDKANSLAVQNVSASELAETLPLTVANVLSFNKDTYRDVVQKAQEYFTPEGYAQYTQFLMGANLEQALAANDFQAGAYTEEQPLNITHGAFEGVYKWLFEVPVTISFLPRFTEEEVAAPTDPINRRFLLRVQMARVNDPQAPESVKIELWQILPPRAQN